MLKKLVLLLYGLGLLSLMHALPASAGGKGGQNSNCNSKKSNCDTPEPQPQACILNILDPVDLTVDELGTISIESLNEFGQRNESFTGDATLLIQGLYKSENLLINLENGFGSGLLGWTNPEILQISLMQASDASCDLSDKEDIYFAHGIPTKYLLDASQSVNVGEQFAVSVRAVDQYNNLATSFQGDVSLGSTGSLLANLMPFDLIDGQATNFLQASIAEDVYLSLVDSFETGLDASATLALHIEGTSIQGDGTTNGGGDTTTGGDGSTTGGAEDPAPSNFCKLEIIDPADITADTSGYLEVLNLNVNGDINLDFLGEAKLKLQGQYETKLIDVFFEAGKAATNFNWTKAESVQISLEGSSVTDCDISSKQDLLVAHGVPSRFILEAPQLAQTGELFQVSVKAVDIYNNLAKSFNEDVSLASTGNLIPNALTIDLVYGQGVQMLQASVAETVMLSLFDSFGTGLDVTAIAEIAIEGDSAPSTGGEDTTTGGSDPTTGGNQDPAPTSACKLEILDPVDMSADDSGMLEVYNLKEDGSIDQEFFGLAKIKLQGYSENRLVDVQFDGGIGVASFSWTKAESVMISFDGATQSDCDLSSKQDLIVMHGMPTQLKLEAPGSALMFEQFPVYVSVTDQYGNMAYNYNDDVMLMSDKESIMGQGLMDINNGFGMMWMAGQEAGMANLYAESYTNYGLMPAFTSIYIEQ